MVLIGVIYIIFRSMGKYLGAHFSAKAVGCDEKTVKYLGITLLPQAGVALGMCVSAQELGAADGLLVRNIVLFSVLIYELVGPLLTKEALTAVLPILENLPEWNQEAIHAALFAEIEKLGVKNGWLLSPLRVAVSGKQFTPGGGIELAVVLGREETLARIRASLAKLG